MKKRNCIKDIFSSSDCFRWREFAIVLCLAVFAACEWGITRYHTSYSLSGEWKRGDSLLYSIPSLEKGEEYHLDVDIRYTSAYPYSNLWLVLTHNLADSTRFVTDTLECKLSDERGHPYGKGVATLYQLRIPYENVRSDGSDCAVMRLTHCMNGEPLQGLTDIGIRVSLAR